MKIRKAIVKVSLNMKMDISEGMAADPERLAFWGNGTSYCGSNTAKLVENHLRDRLEREAAELEDCQCNCLLVEFVRWAEDDDPDRLEIHQAPRGLYQKYDITKQDGTPAEDSYFVLKPEKDAAARAAILAYACLTENKPLAEDLKKWVQELSGEDSDAVARGVAAFQKVFDGTLDKHMDRLITKAKADLENEEAE